MSSDQDECCIRGKASMKFAQTSIEIDKSVFNGKLWLLNICVQWIRLIRDP
jgi:hypothetical protein